MSPKARVKDNSSPKKKSTQKRLSSKSPKLDHQCFSKQSSRPISRMNNVGTENQAGRKSTSLYKNNGTKV